MSKLTFSELSKTRRNNFDLIRFFLASLVILSHAKIEAVTIDANDSMVRFLGAGRMAVNAFFVISGFLIANSWMHSQGLTDYLRKRALRIYPALIVALLFCVLVAGPLGGAQISTYFWDPKTYKFFAPLLLLPNQFLPGVFEHLPHPFEVDGPVWTIQFEILCYLILAGLGLVGILRNRRFAMGIFVLALTLFTMQEFHLPNHWALNFPVVGNINHLPRLVTFFLAGTLFYLYRDRILYSTIWLCCSLIGFVLSYKYLPSVGVPIFGTYLLFYFAFNQKIQFPHFAKYGDFSYGLYLFAWPVEQLILLYFGTLLQPDTKIDRIILFGSTYIITLGLAVLSWNYIEQPFLRLKSKARSAQLIEKPHINEAESIQIVG